MILGTCGRVPSDGVWVGEMILPKLFGGHMFDISESDNIYFPKTKEYFKEVLSSFANGNYRSAVVMLYSIAICDLLFKLQELRDMYDDTVAKEILKEVEDSKNSLQNNSKSKWEKNFIDNVKKKTQILEDKAYCDLNHLYDHRNFSAHPALNENFELITPSKEDTIADIKNIVENILIKPPIFAKKIVDMLTDDIADKKDIFEQQQDKFNEYLLRKYFSHMSDSMKKQTFRSLWKLCFCMPDDEKCRENLNINRKTMERLFISTNGMLDFIKTDSMFSRLDSDHNCVLQLSVLVSRFPEIYDVLKDEIKLQISALKETDPIVYLISWFESNNKSEHMRKIINDNSKNFNFSKKLLLFVQERYEEDNVKNIFLDFCISYFRKSSSYRDADDRYVNVIKPHLNEFSREQFIQIISSIDANNQIYNRYACKENNNEIIRYAKDLLGSDFDYSQFSRFSFDNNLLDDNKEFENEFESVPF